MKINLNQIYDSLIPSSILRTNASNELEYVSPGTNGQVLGIDALGVVNYINPVDLLTAQNGITKLLTGEVELGGTLLHDTIIDQSTFNLNYSNGNFNSTTNPNSALTPYNITVTNNLLGFGIDFSGAYTVDVANTNLYWNGLRINPSFGQEASLGWTDFSNSQSYISANSINFNIARVNTLGATQAWIEGSDLGLHIESPVKLDLKTPLSASKNTGDVLTLVNPVTGEVEYQSITAIVASRTKNVQTVSGTTVTLPTTPNILTLDVYRNGLLQEEGVDYTVSGNTLTFTVTLASEKIASIYFI